MALTLFACEEPEAPELMNKTITGTDASYNGTENKARLPHQGNTT